MRTYFEVLMSDIRSLLASVLEPDALFLGSDAGEFDAAIIGITHRGGHDVLLYDEAKVIACLVLQGMTEEEAWDWWGYNIESAYLGPLTPAYCRTLTAIREQG